LIGNSQHGFREKKSCLTNLLEFSENVTGWLDGGKPVDIIYLDFQKAFDKVPHQRLLLKLAAHGIGGQVLEWIRNWLQYRKQRVVNKGNMSEWSEVISGVPQGSVLGPILFNVYVNDIDDNLRSKILKFADDVKLYGSVGSKWESNNIREDLIVLSKWSQEWQMLFNIEKCKVMHMGAKNKCEKYTLINRDLSMVKEERDLGVIVNDTFKVAKQCLVASKKGNQVLGMISRSFVYRNKIIIKKLYKSLVRPHLEYCIQAWRPHLIKDIEILEKVQRRASRMVIECKGMEYEKRIAILGLTTLETRRRRADLLEVYKILNKHEGIDENSLFTRNIGKTRGNTCKLFKRRSNLDVSKFSFSNRICNDWNELPNEVVTASCINGFKNGVDNILGKWGGFK